MGVQSAECRPPAGGSRDAGAGSVCACLPPRARTRLHAYRKRWRAFGGRSGAPQRPRPRSTTAPVPLPIRNSRARRTPRTRGWSRSPGP